MFDKAGIRIKKFWVYQIKDSNPWPAGMAQKVRIFDIPNLNVWKHQPKDGRAFTLFFDLQIPFI